MVKTIAFIVTVCYRDCRVALVSFDAPRNDRQGWIPDHHAHGVMSGMTVIVSLSSLRAERKRRPGVQSPLLAAREVRWTKTVNTSAIGFRIITPMALCPE